MRIALLSFICALFVLEASSQNMPSHVIYNAKGKKVSYGKMIKYLANQDVVFFGELHDNPIAHWLELEVTKSLNEKVDLILGAEMFEADNQNQLCDYLSGAIDYGGLDSLARLWPNNETDYAPLVDFARENDLDFVASNIPRRFAQKVYKYGFESLDSLSSLEKSWISPLPMIFDPSLPTYIEILDMMGDHGSPELVMAQATKDATMAHFILSNYKPDQLFLHYNGAFHSDKYEGIMWYLKQQKPEIKCGNISTVSQSDVSKLEKEYKGIADFIIVVDEDMTSTY